MATEYLVRLRRNYEHPRGCLCYSLSDSRQDSFTTCLTEASIECRTRKCVRQHLALIGNGSRISRTKIIQQFALISVAILSLFLPCTPKSELRRWHNSLQRRSTRRNLFIDLNGRNRGSQGKAWFW